MFHNFYHCLNQWMTKFSSRQPTLTERLTDSSVTDTHQISGCFTDVIPFRTWKCVFSLHDHAQHNHLLAMPEWRGTSQPKRNKENKENQSTINLHKVFLTSKFIQYIFILLTYTTLINSIDNTCKLEPYVDLTRQGKIKYWCNRISLEYNEQHLCNTYSVYMMTPAAHLHETT